MLEKKQALLDILMDEIPEDSPWQGNIRKLLESLIARGVTVQKHGRWIPRNPAKPDGWHYCSNCKRDITAIKAKYYKFCPECGTVMDLPRITETTAAAIHRIGAAAHGEFDPERWGGKTPEYRRKTPPPPIPVTEEINE